MINSNSDKTIYAIQNGCSRFIDMVFSKEKELAKKSSGFYVNNEESETFVHTSVLRQRVFQDVIVPATTTHTHPNPSPRTRLRPLASDLSTPPKVDVEGLISQLSPSRPPHALPDSHRHPNLPNPSTRIPHTHPTTSDTTPLPHYMQPIRNHYAHGHAQDPQLASVLGKAAALIRSSRRHTTHTNTKARPHRTGPRHTGGTPPMSRPPFAQHHTLPPLDCGNAAHVPAEPFRKGVPRRRPHRGGVALFVLGTGAPEGPA